MPKNDDDLYVFSDENLGDAVSSQDSWFILLVDEEKEYHEAVKNFFAKYVYQDKKFSVHSVYSAAEALEFLQTGPQLSLLLLQVSNAEKNNAIQLLRQIRDIENYKHIPVILYGDAQDCPIAPAEIIEYTIYSYLQSVNAPNTNLYIAVIGALVLLNTVQISVRKQHELEQMQNAAKRFVPHSFLKMLHKDNITDIALTDHVEKEMTVLFLDIRSFTTLSEFLTPVETFEFINHFLSYLEPSVEKNNGFIDKYIGDSVMAIFPDRPIDAVHAGIEMLKALEKYNITRLARYQIPIKIGIGINTGMLVMGVIGFYDRMECTVISDAVNTASRIESLTKKIGAPLLISENTYRIIKNDHKLNTRILGNMGVPGKHEFVAVYEVFDTDPSEILAKKCQTKAEFEEAVKLLNKLNFQAANSLFGKIMSESPHDLPAKYFFEKTSTATEKKDQLL